MMYMTPYRFPMMTENRSARPFSAAADEFIRKFFDMQPSPCEMRVDVEEKEDAYWLKADLPGVSKEDVSVEVQEKILTIQANLHHEEEHGEGKYLCRERYQGTAKRSFRLENIREEEITAQYQEGVLTLRIPKADKEKDTVRRIEIQ